MIADARLKIEKDNALALPCIEKNDNRGKPQAIVTSVDASEEQSDSENPGSCGRMYLYSRSNEDTRSQSRQAKKDGKQFTSRI